MNSDEKVLISLLRSAITHNSWDEFDENERILSLAASHKVGPLLYDLLKSRQLETPFNLQKECEKSVLQFWHLFTLTKQLCDLLSQNGIKVAVLKGISASRDYPVMEYRKSGDVDLLINRSDIDEAKRVLIKTGYRVEEDQKALHHIAFRSPDGIEVEVHTLFAEPFDNKETNRKLEYYSQEALNHIVPVSMEGVEFPFLDDEYQALSLILHMLQHYLRAGFGLKLLTDWVVFWNNRYTPELYKQYLLLIKDLKIDGFSDMVGSVCIRYLGLNAEHMPCNLIEENICEAFLDEVLKGGEFGRSSTDRMVSLRKNSLFEYIREFHHQTCLNFPNASKIFIFWPVLWIITLIRFLINNRKIRHTTLLDVLKTAGDRSRINEKIHLFSEENHNN